MDGRARQGRELLPDLRGEDETNISYLTNSIEIEYATVGFLCPLVTDIAIYQRRRGFSSQPNTQRASWAASLSASQKISVLWTQAKTNQSFAPVSIAWEKVVSRVLTVAQSSGRQGKRHW
jgi:hypothetical protein